MRGTATTFYLAFIVLILAHGSVDAGKRVKRIVGGVSAAPPPPDDPVVFARLYSRNARVEGFRNPLTSLYSFLGIRYADPPTGDDRFLRPRFLQMRGDINATNYGPPCPQPDPQNPNRVVGDEDCLLLNVFTPRLPDESTPGLPVLMFIHGGGFRFGSANQYGPDPLTSKQMVFVPIQYRLGTLGIIGDGTAEFSGNVALFDMAAAVRWVYEYISFFGGDPTQISVVGHGSGATSAVQLSMSDAVDEDMINGVVAMSGSAYTQYSLDDVPKQSIREIAAINNCGEARNEVEIVRCLRKVSAMDLVLHDSQVQVERLQGQRMMRSMTGMAGFSPVVQGTRDGRSLPPIVDEKPDEKLNNGRIRKIPLLTGVTKHETAGGLALPEIQSAFKTATDFLGAVTKSLDLGNLLQTNGKSSGGDNVGLEKVDLLGIGKLLSLKDYLNIPPSLDPTLILEKITEATTDALFNLPALLTTQAWGKLAPSFLYSFEYIGQESRGANFLSGLPIVSKRPRDANNTKVSHGDELAYLFDSLDLFGQPISGSAFTNKTDIQVRNAFTELIANFVQSIAHNDTTTTAKTADPKSLFAMAKSTGSSFIKIGVTAEIEQDFRFCELSLWGASLKPDKTESCAFLVDKLQALGSLTGALDLPTLLPLPALVGGGTLLPNVGPNRNNAPSRKLKKSSGGLFGL